MTSTQVPSAAGALSRRILLATVTAGAGHLQAAAALEEAWRIARPLDVVERVDVLAFASRWFRKAYAEGYLKLVEHSPELYALLFHRSDNPALVRRLTRVRRALARHSIPRFVRHLRAFKPDAVVCTHFLPPEILGGMRAKDPRFRPVLASVVTDFEAHALWTEPAVDLYCVATEETRGRLLARRLAAESVRVTGIPIALKFSHCPTRKAARRALALRDDLPVLLVLSGGFGLGPVAEILRELDQFPRMVQVLVVTGRNAELRRELGGADRRQPTRLLGFVTNMHELMAAADLVITKPGGLTTSEALAVGRPLFILDPIPGQEAANSDFLLQHGAAEKANRVEDLPFRLASLFEGERLAELGRAARKLGRPGAAAAVVAAVAEVVEAFEPARTPAPRPPRS